MSSQFKFTAAEVISKGRTTRTNIEIIKIWLKNCKELCVPRILPDELIVEFLLSCENNTQLTKDTIRAHYNLKKDGPELFDNRDADGEEMKKIFDIWSIATLPARTRENYAIHYFRLDDGDHRKLDLASILKATIMLADVTLEKDPPDGFISINDMKPAGILHFTRIRLDVIKKYFSFLQEGLPMKLKAIHIVNANFVMHKLFNLLKKFIHNDVVDKIHFHPCNVNLDTFYEHIPQNCLTKEFAGDLPSLTELSEITKQQFKNRQDYWDDEEKHRKKYIL